LWELAELSFLKTCTNVVFLGPPGVGKTHLALSLSVKAEDAGYSVLFTTLGDLALDLATVPHQMCQFHALQDASRPAYEVDRKRVYSDA
jgi:DNA replication protein DnaC